MEMHSKLFSYLVVVVALGLASVAASFSVYGIAKLFVGAFYSSIIMAGTLEVSKLVGISFLYRYWKTMNKILRAYLLVGCSVLVLITSAGIYGYLSSAYQSTATESTLMESELAVIDMKRTRYNDSRAGLLEQRQQLDTTIGDLRISLSNPTQIQYVDQETGHLVTTISTNQRRVLQDQLSTAVTERSLLDSTLTVVSDSIAVLDIASLWKEISNEAARELGPLKYISGLTGIPMDRVINWFLLLIIFVFDPMAIALIIGANMAFMSLGRKDEHEVGVDVATDMKDYSTGAGLQESVSGSWEREFYHPSQSAHTESIETDDSDQLPEVDPDKLFMLHEGVSKKSNRSVAKKDEGPVNEGKYLSDGGIKV